MNKPQGIKTNGIGNKTTAHLNLTVTLAEAWRKDPMSKIRIKPRDK